MAAYKKRPNDLGPRWFSSMKAAFCLFPASAGHGRPRAGRLCCDARDIGTRYRPFRRSACRPDAGAWRSTRGSTATRTSNPPRLSSSSGSSSSTCGVRWSFCGTTAPNTRAKLSGLSWKDTRAWRSSVSRVMRPSSTRTNTFGTILSAPWPTAPRPILGTSRASCIRRFNGSGNRRSFCGLASTLPAFLGGGDRIHYLFKSQ